MATYSMPLRAYIDMWSQDRELSTRERIEKGRSKLFDFDYPLYDPAYRKVFETHFIRHFYMREIGFETEALFKFQLETWLLINMPYYNKLFESELLTYNPLFNTDLKETAKREKDREQKDNRTSNQTSNAQTKGKSESEWSTNSTDKQTGSSKDDSFTRNIESDTPDQRLALTAKDGEGVIEYASKLDEHTSNDAKTSNKTGESKANSQSEDAAESNSTAKADQKDTLSSDINEIEDYINHRVGKTGSVSYSQLVTEYRETLLRIEKQIFNEMNELFMLVY